MRFFYLVILIGLTNFIYGQDISLTYKKDNGNSVKDIAISKNTKLLVVEGVKSFKNFALTVKNLPAKHTISVQDDAGSELGSFTADGTKNLTAGAELNNVAFKIIHTDDKGVKTEFATVLIQILPKPTISVLAKLPQLTAAPGKVCDPCDFKHNALVYDFANNSIDYNKKDKWLGMKISGGHPVVGKPYSVIVKNLNPFRDSVVIGSETADFNTDVPELFNKAFFSPALQGLNEQQTAILADVLELGEQLKKIISFIKDSKECTDICEIIQKTKDETEQHFKTAYKFDQTKQDLISFIAKNLEGADPLQRDSVATILNDYRNFYSAKTYFNYNIPQVQNVDQYIFTLSVLPKAGAKSYTIVDHQPITVNTIGGVKFDFSSGLFVTKLRDLRFMLKPDSSVIRNTYGGDSIVFNRRNQIVQLTDQKKSDFGVAALMHFYPRISSVVNVSLSLGAGVSIGPNPAIRYLGGGTLLLGRSGRLGFTYGCAAGFVDVLADNYQNQQYISLGDPKAITKKVFKTNSFWALTFNIPLFKSKVKTEEPKKEETSEPKKEEEKNKEGDDKSK